MHEIHKEKIIYKDSDGSPRVREEIREHIYEDHQHVVHEGRHNNHSRRVVRREILSFRHGAYLILDIIQVLLIARFFVELFGFSSVNSLVNIIRMVTYPLIAPFGNIITYVMPTFALNWSILIAMLVYGLLAYIFIALFESGMRGAYRRH